MEKLNIKDLNLINIPDFLKRIPYVIKFVENITGLNELNTFISQHGDKYNFHFIDEVFDYLDFTFSFSIKDKEKIPSEGNLIIVANHPSGGLDGLMLLRLVKEVRNDVKIVVNDKLFKLENLKDLFLPLDITDRKYQIKNIKTIGDSLKNNEAIIFFPAGEVSRFSSRGINDKKWNEGIVKFSIKYNCPILPVFIDAQNSYGFYLLSFLNKRISEYFLMKELLNKKSKSFKVKIGEQIPAGVFSNNRNNFKYDINQLRKHTYLIGKGKTGIFRTEKNIIHPIKKNILKNEISNCEVLKETYDFKKILLTNMKKSPNIIREIARLREITFRKVGTGTGKKLDLDIYDGKYEHIVLWDENDLEIIGSYRIGLCKKIIDKDTINGLYTSTLFNFSSLFIDLLPDSIELGRSFVQSKYWNSNVLDYLWQGIGAFLNKNKNIKYMFGGVSLNNTYSQSTKELLVFFFQKWFGQYRILANAKNKFIISEKRVEVLLNIFSGDNFNLEMLELKSILREYGYSIPTLFKHYSNLCDPGGVKFIDFTVDPKFKNSIDGLIFVEIDKIKDSKKNRYIKSSPQKEKNLKVEIVVD